MRSITTELGLDADATTIWRQVSLWTWAGMGARPSQAMRLRDGLQVPVRMERGQRTLIIKLNARDLYDVEIGRVNRRALDWVVIAQRRDIDAESLDRTVQDLFDAVN